MIQNEMLDLSEKLGDAQELTEAMLSTLTTTEPTTQAQTKHGDKVKHLNLSKNKLTKISLQLLFRYFPNLESLNVSENQITELTTPLQRDETFAALKIVNLSKNKIENPSKLHLECFTEMTSLNLSQNKGFKIERLDEFEQNKKQLEYLILAGNPEIKKLDSATATTKFEALKFLDLSFCGLEQATNHSFSSCPKLEYLNLDGNAIKNCQNGKAAFENLPELRHLSLRGNRLITISYDRVEDEIGILPLKGLKRLTTLLLDGNCISIIQPGCFNGSEALQWLCLSGQAGYASEDKPYEWGCNVGMPRKLKLEKKSFYGLRNLTTLTLSYNQLEIQEDAFSGLVELQYLEMENCQLKGLPETMVSQLPKATRISVKNNVINAYPIFTFTFGNIRFYANQYSNILTIFDGFQGNPAAEPPLGFFAKFRKNHPDIITFGSAMKIPQTAGWCSWGMAKLASMGSKALSSKKSSLAIFTSRMLPKIYSWLPSIIQRHNITTTALAATTATALIFAYKKYKAYKAYKEGLNKPRGYGKRVIKFDTQELKNQTFANHDQPENALKTFTWIPTSKLFSELF